ncbi:hypothetical protein AZI86_01305 [Bdellovibrio bacteriovorus]|uniref:AB hydrolase-1 domain-containing protein n=1 Tax=Bdellovibrio bacteriovorus TaxID=959 RepID=A0A150WMM4_BDEBC|nr:alpha/beta hydrolase [Bdellovibrio bacteriovorus]KYG65741.1 hypothetical protein AZI86_01305 [Bdellovibrio bacteriovorus]
MSIVFLPGFLCDERVWHHQVKALSREMNTEVLDLRHCLDLEGMIQKVVNASWSQFHLVGFSMGGYVAQVFATKHPERLQSLSIIASSGSKLSETDLKGRQRMESILKNAKYRGISPKEMARYIHPKHLENREITDLIVAMSAENTSEMYLNQMRATLHRHEHFAELEALDFPILIVGAKDDRVVTPEEIQSLVKGIPRAEHHMIAECGHYIPLEKPVELTGLLHDFLTRNQKSG